MTTLQKKNLNTWMNRFVAWVLIVLSCVLLGGKAYAAEIQMGADGMLVFEPCELTVDVGEKVTFINNELPPHNVMFADYQELSHGDLMFSAGESFDVTFDKAGDYYFQGDPHAGAGMKGGIHVE